METSYAAVAAALERLGGVLPVRLATRTAHLDPDFENLTYGDKGERARQIRDKLGPGDRLVFYSSLRDAHEPRRLVYALIGVLEIERNHRSP